MKTYQQLNIWDDRVVYRDYIPSPPNVLFVRFLTRPASRVEPQPYAFFCGYALWPGLPGFRLSEEERKSVKSCHLSWYDQEPTTLPLPWPAMLVYCYGWDDNHLGRTEPSVPGVYDAIQLCARMIEEINSILMNRPGRHVQPWALPNPLQSRDTES